jgi:hypothetical protein
MVIHFICTTYNSSKLSKPIAKLMVNPTALHNETTANPIPHQKTSGLIPNYHL